MRRNYNQRGRGDWTDRYGHQRGHHDDRGHQSRRDEWGRRNNRRFPDRDEHPDHRPQRRRQESQRQPEPSTSKQYHLGYKKLKDLDNDLPGNALLHLNNSRNGYIEFLDDCESMKKLDCVDLLLNILLKCTDEGATPEILKSVLKTFVKSKFMSPNFTNLCLVMKDEAQEQKQLKLRSILTKALNLTANLLQRLPTDTFPIASSLYGTLSLIMTPLRSKTMIVDDTVLNIYTKLKEDTDYYVNHSTVQTNEYRSVNDENPPPNDFRTVSVTPTREDILVTEEPYVRANKVIGAYTDVNHYLDVHFRLLREDFVAPLRRGVDDYLTSNDRKRFADVTLYKNVRIVKPTCRPVGLLYVLQLDINSLRGINWQSSKKLKNGSLVCLSKDQFQTFLIATVQERKIETLGNMCQISVQFPDTSEAMTQCNFDANYDMLETDAYFESYRHVLKGLQNIQETMAFKEHLVFCSSDVEAPSYLKRGEDIRVDFNSILPEDATDRMKEAFRHVPPLDVSKWPKAEHLGLDPSQWKALHNAVTKRLSLIQGPPGTGKTFIGLKLVKFLLANYKIWADDGNSMRPILVVCYTNHALDQFLEGILKFTNSNEIVRVGGRSRSDLLEASKMTTLRKNVNKRSKHICTAFQALSANTDQLNISENAILELATKTECAYKKILPANELRDHMTEEQERSLSYDNNCSGDPMKEWLGYSGYSLERIIRTARKKNSDVMEVDEADILEELEAIENQRGYDTDEESDEDLYTHEMVSDEDDDEEWAALTREDKRVLRRALAEKTGANDIMSENEAQNAGDVWDMNDTERWRLYRHWMKCYQAELNEKVGKQHVKYTKLANQRNEIMDKKDAIIMKHAKVIGMTTTGCAKYKQILATLQPKIVVVEEAAEILEAHVITSLSERCEHLVMIGDHQQLRPSTSDHRTAKKFKLDISLFERLIKNDLPYDCLQLQHRMRPEISTPMLCIYPELRDAESVKSFDNIRGVAKNLFFIDHGHKERSDRETRSHANDHEASFMICFCRYILQQGYTTSQITMLAPYAGQIEQFQDYQRRKHLQDELKGVNITTVDNYQGEENDIILLSLVRSNNDEKIGFLAEDNRVCVALSRARKGLFVIGNLKLMKSVDTKSSLWRRLLQQMHSESRIGEFLELKCQTHYQEEPVRVSKASDFDRVAEGGCHRPCQFRLRCGHTCPRQCHSYDPGHIELSKRCFEPCARTPCEVDGHVCKKRCRDDCGPCQYQTNKILPRCGHKQDVLCGENLDAVSCKQPCPQRLSCGHPCTAGCGRPCKVYCRVPVKKIPLCGHEQTADCSKHVEEIVCKVRCDAKLSCGHKCTGNCHSCYKGHIHKSCTYKCERTLVCGHKCGENCSETCPPCKKECRSGYVCQHSHCRLKCGEECVKCVMRCMWVCKHRKCSKLCYEPCNRERCNEPCELKVPAKVHQNRERPRSCGHPCIGVCGERCPKLCRICDRRDLEVILGSKVDRETRFIELEDCGHIFPVRRLDQLFDEDVSGQTTRISMKRCPHQCCGEEIRKNFRYGNAIKRALADIKKVKFIIRGDTHGNNMTDVQHVRTILQAVEPFMNPFTLYSGFPDGNQSPEKLYPGLRSLEDHLQQFMSESDPDMKARSNVIAMTFKAECLEQLVDVLKNFERLLGEMNISRSGLADYGRFMRDLEHVTKYLIFTDKTTRTGGNKPRLLFSNQQIEDTQWFIHRLEHFSKFMIISAAVIKEGKDVETLIHTIRGLLTAVPYRESRANRAQTHLEELKKECDVPGLSIAGAGVDVANARNQELPVGGSWYKCREGHIFAVCDSGGATEEVSCNMCGASSGGDSHQEISRDGQPATEMEVEEEPTRAHDSSRQVSNENCESSESWINELNSQAPEDGVMAINEDVGSEDWIRELNSLISEDS